MESTFDLFRTDISVDINALDLAVRLLVGLLLSAIIVFHYNRNSMCLSERAHFSRIFPFVLMTTLLVIAVVKSSLALSLGLVGALSIVRFRTPIKEPEDLAYLFICIASGVGLGAGVILVTSMAVIFILTAATLFFRLTNKHLSFPHYLTISKNENDSSTDFTTMIEVVGKYTVDVPKIRRVDYLPDSVDALVHISMSQDTSVLQMLSELQSKWPDVEYTVMDQSKVPVS